MSNIHPKILLKMNAYLYDIFFRFENVLHPAAGKLVAEKKRKRSSAAAVPPKATPDSLDIRDQFKKQDGFRRNPAP